MLIYILRTFDAKYRCSVMWCTAGLELISTQYWKRTTWSCRWMTSSSRRPRLHAAKYRRPTPRGRTPTYASKSCFLAALSLAILFWLCTRSKAGVLNQGCRHPLGVSDANQRGVRLVSVKWNKIFEIWWPAPFVADLNFDQLRWGCQLSRYLDYLDYEGGDR